MTQEKLQFLVYILKYISCALCITSIHNKRFLSKYFFKNFPEANCLILIIALIIKTISNTSFFPHLGIRLEWENNKKIKNKFESEYCVLKKCNKNN